MADLLADLLHLFEQAVIDGIYLERNLAEKLEQKKSGRFSFISRCVSNQLVCSV